MMEMFFTDDERRVPVRDARRPQARRPRPRRRPSIIEAVIEAHRGRIRKLADGRLHIPADEPYMEGHNTWCVNRPGQPAADPGRRHRADADRDPLLHHAERRLACSTTSTASVCPAMERFRDLVNVDEPFPLSFLEQYALTEATAELTTSCYAGMLMLQGDGARRVDVRRHRPIHRCSARAAIPRCPASGSTSQTDERWALPNPTGARRRLHRVLPAALPGHARGGRGVQRAEVRSRAARSTRTRPGPWSESARVRGAAAVHSDEFKDVRGDPGPVRLRSLREVPRHRAEPVLPHVPAGPPPGSRVLRRALRRPGRICAPTPSTRNAGTDGVVARMLEACRRNGD